MSTAALKPAWTKHQAVWNPSCPARQKKAPPWATMMVPRGPGAPWAGTNTREGWGWSGSRSSKPGAPSSQRGMTRNRATALFHRVLLATRSRVPSGLFWTSLGQSTAPDSTNSFKIPWFSSYTGHPSAAFLYNIQHTRAWRSFPSIIHTVVSKTWCGGDVQGGRAKPGAGSTYCGCLL